MHYCALTVYNIQTPTPHTMSSLGTEHTHAHTHVHSLMYQFPSFFVNLNGKALRGSDNMRMLKECQLNGIITSYITLLTSMSSAFHFRAAILSYEHKHWRFLNSTNNHGNTTGNRANDGYWQQNASCEYRCILNITLWKEMIQEYTYVAESWMNNQNNSSEKVGEEKTFERLQH